MAFWTLLPPGAYCSVSQTHLDFLIIIISPNLTPACIIPTDCALNLNRGQSVSHFGPSNEFHSSSFLIAARLSIYAMNLDVETGRLFPDAGA